MAIAVTALGLRLRGLFAGQTAKDSDTFIHDRLIESYSYHLPRLIGGSLLERTHLQSVNDALFTIASDSIELPWYVDSIHPGITVSSLVEVDENGAPFAMTQPSPRTDVKLWTDFDKFTWEFRKDGVVYGRPTDLLHIGRYISVHPLPAASWWFILTLQVSGAPPTLITANSSIENHDMAMAAMYHAAITLAEEKSLEGIRDMVQARFLTFLAPLQRAHNKKHRQKKRGRQF